MSDIQFSLNTDSTQDDTAPSTLPFEVTEKTVITDFIEFVTHEGTRESFVYGTLWGVKSIPDEGIEINFTGAEVIITGSHLDALYEAVRDRKVIRITESQRLEAIPLDDTPKVYIKKIDITYISHG